MPKALYALKLMRYGLVILYLASCSAFAAGEVCEERDTPVHMALKESSLTPEAVEEALLSLETLSNSLPTDTSYLEAWVALSTVEAYFAKLEIDRALTAGDEVDPTVASVFCKHIGKQSAGI